MNSAEKMNWFVVLARPARSSLKHIPPRDRARIRAAIDEMEGNPLQGDIRKLRGGREGFRRPVGDWRIFFDISPERRVLVTAIEKRTSTTY
jgi:mRNA-degrading endonuclease RelE of RelBE toxin-antitoxin system